MVHLLNRLFKVYAFLPNKSAYKRFFIIILYLIEIFIIISILDEIFPAMVLGLLRGIHYILLATVLSLFVIKLEALGIKTQYTLDSKSMMESEFKIFNELSISIIILWLAFGIVSLWSIPLFEKIYLSLAGIKAIDYFLLALTIMIGLASIYILCRAGEPIIPSLLFKSLIALSIVLSIILSKTLFYDVYATMFTKMIEIMSFMIFTAFFSSILDKITFALSLSKESLLEVPLKEPKVITIEYHLTSFGSDKSLLAKALVDKLTEPSELGREIDRFDSILIYTIRGSPLIDYLEGNLMYYLTDEEGKSSIPIYTITLSRSLTLPKLYPTGKDIWRYEVGIDPTYTPYVIERIRKEKRSKNMLVIIENPVDLINLIGFKRFYELLHSIIERLRSSDILVIFTPIDLIDEKALNALRNIAMKVIMI